MKRILILILPLLFFITGCNNSHAGHKNLPAPEKPVIYLYPEEEMTVEVKLDFGGTLTSTYPAYNDGWTVTAQPDGALIDPATGKEYYCLFWEGIADTDYAITSGFVVAGKDTEAFLEESLAALGLNPRETNEFIIYWLPRMEHNAWNLISFDTQTYLENAKLTISPAPDSVLRVFMTWQAMDAPVEITPQELPAFVRTGFTVVEWGGAEISK